MITVYGLKSCDTCRKALAWLKDEKLAHKFHDLRADGISATEIARFARAAGWEKLLNKASTTWRGLADKDKDGVTEARAIALMAEHPALIKRPVFAAGARIVVGFRDAEKAALKALSR
ncbi:MAG TPA: Spx/MgsR family RNA polymerase-binding regulatory protein [Parvibaculum sp.]